MKIKNIEKVTSERNQADSTSGQNEEKFAVYLEKAHACYEMQDYSNCIKHAEMYQTLHSEDPESYYLKSLACDKLGWWIKAKLSHRQFVKKAKRFTEDGDVCEWWWEQSHQYYKLGQLNREIFCYDALLKINPKDHVAIHEKACVLRDLGKVEESLPYFDRAMKIGPEDEEYWLALTNKGTALAKISRHEEAISLYDQSLLNPDNNWDRLGETWHAKGESLMKLSKYEDALQSFQEAQENGWYYSGLKSKGHALAALGRYEEAIECWDAVIKQLPQLSEVLMAKADAFRKLGKAHEARICSRQARECKR
ncbi:MAG: tetratricopeptide repeat protein [Dehalococcoidia bacterium]|jgi:tetratricopeptide (TPR) repeat protein